MDFSVAFIVITVALLEVQGKTIGPVRPGFNNSSHVPPQPGQQRYKEVILYLTPSQIRALEQGQGIPNPPQAPQVDGDRHAQAYVHSQAHHPNGQLHPHLAQPQPLKTPPLQEPQSDPFIPIAPPPRYRQLEAPAYNSFQPPNQKRVLKPIPFFPDPNKEPKAPTALGPQEPLSGKDPHDQPSRQQLKEQWLDLLNQNIAHFKNLKLSQAQKEKSTENKNFHYTTQNDFRYNDQKYASEVYKLVRNNNEQEIEQQQALLQAEAIANSPPILVHKEININHSLGRLIAHVPIPTPIFIPVPELKVPRVFTIPLEFLGIVPVPITKVHDDRSVPFGEQKQNLPAIRNAHVDRPILEGQGVPLENPHDRGNLQVHSHEWHH